MIERDNPKDEVGSFEPPRPERRRIVFSVPPSAPVAKCRSCGAPVVWVVTANGRRMPVNHDTRESHFATCPDGLAWRNKVRR